MRIPAHRKNAPLRKSHGGTMTARTTRTEQDAAAYAASVLAETARTARAARKVTPKTDPDTAAATTAFAAMVADTAPTDTAPTAPKKKKNDRAASAASAAKRAASANAPTGRTNASGHATRAAAAPKTELPSDLKELAECLPDRATDRADTLVNLIGNYVDATIRARADIRQLATTPTDKRNQNTALTYLTEPLHSGLTHPRYSGPVIVRTMVRGTDVLVTAPTIAVDQSRGVYRLCAASIGTATATSVTRKDQIRRLDLAILSARKDSVFGYVGGDCLLRIVQHVAIGSPTLEPDPERAMLVARAILSYGTRCPHPLAPGSSTPSAYPPADNDAADIIAEAVTDALTDQIWRSIT